MITTTALELRAGARILLSEASLRVQPGDRIGLVGRNGAGKTTTLKVLAGEGQPFTGAVDSRGPVGYLPQDPRTGDLEVTAANRVLSARGLDAILSRDEGARGAAGDGHRRPHAASVRHLWKTSSPGSAGTRPRPRRPGSAPTSACPTGSWPRRWARSPAASAGASSSPGSCSGTRPRPAAASCCSTSRRTTSTPTRSPGCAASSPAHKGGLIVISHDVNLLDAVVNKVWYLDANRSTVDVYNVGWKTYLQQRETRREAPPPGARERREEGRRADGAGGQDAGEGDQDRGRAEHGPPGRADCSPAWKRYGPRTRWPRCGSRPRCRAARRR